MSEWRAIETAPKDGTQVLAYWIYDAVMQIACWEGPKDRRGSWCNTDGDNLNTPTHWMPLPPPPTEDKR